MKTVAGKEYGYLVQNTWKNGKVRQKVKKYLGPVLRPDKKDPLPFSAWKDVDVGAYISNTPPKRILRALIKWTLARHYMPTEVSVRGFDVKRGEKSVVLALNDGFLCRDTLRHVIHFKPVEEEQRGKALADTLTSAGILVDKELFVLLYRKLYNI